MRFKFFTHQRNAFNYAKYKRSIALFMEMRLGKSLVALRWALSRKRDAKILIVCPISVMASWQEECEREGHDLVQLVGIAKKRLSALEAGFEANKQVYCINYEALYERGHKTARGKTKLVPSIYALQDWDVVVLDESTYIKNPKAQCTRVALKNLSQAPFKAILTGLPTPEGIQDIICQYLFLYGRILTVSDYWQFRARYMDLIFMHEYAINAEGRKELKRIKNEECFVLSRDKAGIGSKKIYSKRYVKIPDKIIKAIIDAEKDFEIDGKMTNNKLEVLTWIGQMCGGVALEGYTHNAKLNEVKYLLSSELKNEKVIIFARSTAELNAINEMCKQKLKLKSAIIYGKLTKEENDKTKKKFQSGKLDVLVCQTKMVKMGIDLSISDTVIYFSNYYDYEIRAQSEDRVIHPDKKKPVLILDLVADVPFEHDLIDCLTDKSIEAKDFMGSLFAKINSRKNINGGSMVYGKN